ncbi:MAG: lysine transporter LysE [Gammaproteobacteria bacterium]|nr:MAG: lysine transporter LysE [Gammaproteobacteria bacterium]
MEHSLALFIFTLTATITPGPNNIMIMTSGLNFGIKKSLPHLFGICLGFPLMVVLVGLGFSVVFEQYPLFHQVIKILGILYLLYLSWRIATSPINELDQGKAKPLSFIQAAAFQWVNPKAWVMASGAVAAFTSATSDMTWQVLYIALSFLLVAFPSVGMWLVFGQSLKRLLRNPLHQRLFNISMAILLVLSMVPVIREVLTST